MSGADHNPPPLGAGLSAMQMQALTQHLERLMKQQNDELHERLDQMDNRDNREENRRRRRDNDGEQRQNRIEGVKLKIPPFKGKGDPETYLEWEMKIEQVFSCSNYTEEQKMKLAAAEFSDYALIWWNKLQKERRNDEEPLVDTWAEMRRIMRKRYVPASYNREVQLKLQKLTQGNMSVEDYYKVMEVTMIRAKTNEDNEVTMARFLNGLNHDIRDVVELQEYVEMEDLLHKSIQVEQQLKRKSTARRSSSNFSPTNWRDKSKKEGSSSSKPTEAGPLRRSPKQPNEKTTKTRDVKCFRCLGRGHYASDCPTKRVIILKDNGEYTSESSASEGEESGSDEEVEAIDGDLLMIRRLLGNQVRVFDDSQRENIFHTRCSINGKICSVIVDGGSCTNVASARLVSKLNLDTKPHPRPYKLQWLSKDGELCVSKQVELCLSMGRYSDMVLCDVVPMEASHILLGRPWQYDTKAIHDGFTNKISFIHNGKKIVLKLMSPREVCEDQIKIRETIAQERK